MLQAEIQELQVEIDCLRKRLREKEERLYQLKQEQKYECPYSDVLTTEEISRYSRQMIMPQIAVPGQVSLKNSKVLIVGAGGLGCPAALYLAAAGIGEIHVMDYDVVELSNLHRQILHCESDVNVPKVQSVKDKLLRLNSNIEVVTHQIHMNSSLTSVFETNKFDVVLDCSDNVPTRYLLNDVCVLYDIPLVSGSALQMEGQLTVYNYRNGPCYRCLFPVPPPAYTVTSCGDGGVLGAVPGTIGVLQALEAIKIITKAGGILSGRLLLFDGSQSLFRNVKLRSRVASCNICGDNPKIKSLIDYEQFCGTRAHDKVTDVDILKESEHVDVREVNYLLKNDNIVVDVRPELEYSMCRLIKTINIPFTLIQHGKGLHLLENEIETKSEDTVNVYVLCRRGNDSQRAVLYLKEHFANSSLKFFNLKGGLLRYSKLVDPYFPIY